MMEQSSHSDLWLVRHGESKSQSGEEFSFDANLSELGAAQAERLGKALHGIRFDRVFISPLKRARQTFENSGIMGSSLLAGVRFDSRLIEPLRDGYGSLLPYPELPAYAASDSQDAWGIPVEERMASFLNEVRGLAGTVGNILAIGHGIAMGTLLNIFFNGGHAPSCGLKSCHTVNASISVLRLVPPGSGLPDALVSWNVQTHLEGLPGHKGGNP